MCERSANLDLLFAHAAAPVGEAHAPRVDIAPTPSLLFLD